jgi:transposase
MKMPSRLLQILLLLLEVEMDRQIQQWHRSNEASQRLPELAGVGPITATAMVASIGDARNFSSGRQLAAWLGLVPRQRSSGGKSLLLGSSKRGDCYLRTLLIHGARAVIRCAGRKKKDEVTATEGISTTQSRNWLQISGLAKRNECGCCCSGQQKCTGDLGVVGP